jgi:cell division protease FtsH
MVLLALGALAFAFLAYSWLIGYTRYFRDNVTNEVLSVKVRPGPLDTLRHVGTLFPEFLRGSLPMLLEGLFFLCIIVFQFVAIFWFLSKGQSYTIFPGEYDVSFDDVRGQPAIVDATREVVKLFEGFKDFRKMGGYPPHGILFEGPPGTGKTLLGKAIAGETNVPFLYANGTSFTSMFMGVGNMRVSAMFRKARKLSREYDGAVIFIDELDALAATRGGVSAARSVWEDPAAPMETRDYWTMQSPSVNRFFAPGGGNGANSMLVNELLVQMDGLVLPKRRFRTLRRLLGLAPKVPNYNLLIIGATNRAATLDPALLRPGRFDRKIHVGNPTAEGRKDIIRYYLDKVKHAGVDVDKLAGATVGYSPARLKNIINEGLIFALQGGRDAVTYDDIWQAMLTDEIGLKQPVTYSPWEKEATAIHEAGHAVAAWFEKPSESVQVVTIQKREETLGLVHTMDTEERFSRTRDEFLADIRVSLAGLAAEQLWYGQTTSGTASDLRAATLRAAQMVAYLGMGSSLLSAGAVPPQAYGGGEDGLASFLARGPIRDEVEQILERCRAEVTELLQRKAYCVEAVRDRLLVDEQLTGDQFAGVMHAVGESRDGRVVTLRKPPRALGGHLWSLGAPVVGGANEIGPDDGLADGPARAV